MVSTTRRVLSQRMLVIRTRQGARRPMKSTTPSWLLMAGLLRAGHLRRASRARASATRSRLTRTTRRRKRRTRRTRSSRAATPTRTAATKKKRRRARSPSRVLKIDRVRLKRRRLPSKTSTRWSHRSKVSRDRSRAGALPAEGARTNLYLLRCLAIRRIIWAFRTSMRTNLKTKTCWHYLRKCNRNLNLRRTVGKVIHHVVVSAGSISSTTSMRTCRRTRTRSARTRGTGVWTRARTTGPRTT